MSDHKDKWPRYRCCEHCLTKFGQCADNGIHFEPCPEPCVEGCATK